MYDVSHQYRRSKVRCCLVPSTSATGDVRYCPAWYCPILCTVCRPTVLMWDHVVYWWFTVYRTGLLYQWKLYSVYHALNILQPLLGSSRDGAHLKCIHKSCRAVIRNRLSEHYILFSNGKTAPARLFSAITIILNLIFTKSDGVFYIKRTCVGG